MTVRTDTLPPPDGVIHGDVDGYPANKGNGYTVATVRRLLAERDERIRVLTEALDVLLGRMNMAVHKTPDVAFITDEPDALRRAMVNAADALAKGNK